MRSTPTETPVETTFESKNKSQHKDNDAAITNVKLCNAEKLWIFNFPAVRDHS